MVAATQPKQTDAIVQELKKALAAGQVLAMSYRNHSDGIILAVTCNNDSTANRLVNAGASATSWDDPESNLLESLKMSLAEPFAAAKKDTRAHSSLDGKHHTLIEAAPGPVADELLQIAQEFEKAHPKAPVSKLNRFDQQIIDALKNAGESGILTGIKKNTRIGNTNSVEIRCKDEAAAATLSRTLNAIPRDALVAKSSQTATGFPQGKNIFFEITSAPLIEAYRTLIQEFNRAHHQPGLGLGEDYIGG